MKKALRSLSVSCFLLINLTIGLIQARMLQKSIMVRVVEEKIDNKIFTHRVDIIDGKKKELWAIDSKEVSLDQYEEAILVAELQERKVERRKQERLQAEREAFMFEAQRNGLLNLIKCYTIEINQIIQKYGDNRLNTFLVFNKSTIGSQDELNHLYTELLPKAQQVITENTDQLDLQELKQIVTTLEPYPEKLQNFYFASIANAQTNADDTRLLKDLLVLVSEIA